MTSVPNVQQSKSEPDFTLNQPIPSGRLESDERGRTRQNETEADKIICQDEGPPLRKYPVPHGPESCLVALLTRLFGSKLGSSSLADLMFIGVLQMGNPSLASQGRPTANRFCGGSFGDNARVHGFAPAQAAEGFPAPRPG